MIIPLFALLSLLRTLIILQPRRDRHTYLQFPKLRFHIIRNVDRLHCLMFCQQCILRHHHHILVDSPDMQTVLARCDRPHLVDRVAIRPALHILEMGTVEMHLVCPLCLAMHIHLSIHIVDRHHQDRLVDLFHLVIRALFRLDINLEVFHLPCRTQVQPCKFHKLRRELLRSVGSLRQALPQEVPKGRALDLGSGNLQPGAG